MAKKKKRKIKSRPQEVSEPNLFWRQAAAVLLFLLAVFLLLGSFGAGGPFPTGLFGFLDLSLGLGAYLVPVALVYFGVLKFQAEDHKVPFKNLSSMVMLILFVAGFLFTAFAKEVRPGEFESLQGGTVGAIVGGIMLKALSSIPASITFVALSTLAMFFSFGISPLVIGNLFKFKGREKSDEEADMARLSTAATNRNFKLNEGVPVEHSKAKTPSRSIMKNSAPMKLSKQEDHSALTAPNDPDWKFPGMDLLNQKQDKADPGDVEANAMTIQETLRNFNINVEMEGANIGPRVTQYTLKPPAGVKLSKITALDSNIALDLGANAIRMEAPIPGKKAVGIEVPNRRSATVRFSSIVSSSEWRKMSSPLSIVIGKDIAGTPVVGALDKMPHMLVAGQTGSGKSVMVNTLLTSLLYRNSPSQLKLILVDPKQVEMAPYADIPHLLTPVITEPEKCISALKWAVAEMERRYKTLAENKKRNIVDYNSTNRDESMPYIVIVIDELADLMMMAARDVEALIVRIAQKARAVGIHLILATQRPSVDVITGLIKANVPARIAFTVASQVDSRTIIDNVGAEKLLGMGDMLFATTDMPRPKRVQGAWITDEETAAIMDFFRVQRPPQYDDEVVSQPVQIGKGGIVADYSNDGSQGDEAEFKDAVHVVLEAGKASTSLLQRRLRIGYGKAARLMEQMEDQGIISAANGSKPREVLITSMDDIFGSTDADIAVEEA